MGVYLLTKIDAWMTSHPWHPRVVPFFVYVGMLPLIAGLRDQWPITYPFTYTFQCGLVIWLLWRYRRLLPELTLSFHWAAVPTGLVVAYAWIEMGSWMARTAPDQFAVDDPTNLVKQVGPTAGWVAMGLRLLGMSLVVPLFEELFIRSLLLRSFHRFKQVTLGVVQILLDVPLIGDKLFDTRLGNAANDTGHIFGPEFHRNQLGWLSVTGFVVSTAVFTIHHTPRDWPGCVACALAYCLLLRATSHKGLGPVCWAHGITNASLWAYTLYSDDWQFL